MKLITNLILINSNACYRYVMLKLIVFSGSAMIPNINKSVAIYIYIYI